MCVSAIKKPHISDFADEKKSFLRFKNTFPLTIMGILPLTWREQWMLLKFYQDFTEVKGKSQEKPADCHITFQSRTVLYTISYS